MSLNIGAVATKAVEALRGDENFTRLREQLGILAQANINLSLGSTIETRIEQTAYARALRDVWVALEAAATGTRANNVQPPKIKA